MRALNMIASLRIRRDRYPKKGYKIAGERPWEPLRMHPNPYGTAISTKMYYLGDILSRN